MRSSASEVPRMAVKIPWQCVAVLAVSAPFTLPACLVVLMTTLPLTAWYFLFQSDYAVPDVLTHTVGPSHIELNQVVTPC